jgi:hypothetical protein
VCFLCTIWNFVGPCGLQVGITSGYGQDCNDSRFRTTYISKKSEGNFGSHMILHEFYQRLCADHNTYGKFAKEGRKFPMERGLSKGIGHLKVEIRDCADLIFSDWNKEFHVHIDALYIALGAILSQPKEGDIDHPISFVIRKLSIVEKNYTTTEQE